MAATIIYEHVDLYDRIFQLRTSDNEEDERHLLIVCTCLNHERQKLYNLVSQSVTDLNLLCEENVL